jgi:hypothetical protein
LSEARTALELGPTVSFQPRRTFEQRGQVVGGSGEGAGPDLEQGMSDDIYGRVMQARKDFMRKMLEPDSLYLGREEYKQWRRELSATMLMPTNDLDDGLVTTYVGLKVFLVNKEHHFAVALTQP